MPERSAREFAQARLEMLVAREVADGLMSHATMFFAPVFGAPERRKPFAETGSGS